MLVKKSVFNRVITIKNNRSLLVNTLSGALDIVPDYYCEYLEMPLCQAENDITDFLKERCYLIGANVDEYELIKELYTGLQTVQRRQTPLKCMLIVTFDCNLKCSYCWQQHNLPTEKSQTMSKEMVDAALTGVAKLASIIEEKSEKPPLIQIFGGEPLLAENADLIEYILKECARRRYYVQITTNGVNLRDFQDMIFRYNVQEIQVTLDGTEDIHNKRRAGSDFRSIMDSLGEIIRHNALYVKLRVNVDHSNLHSLRGLADEIIERRWFTSRKFYAYLAPLRDSSFAAPMLIAKRRKLLTALEKTKRVFPQLEIFDVLGWDGYQPVRILEKTGKFPYPKAYACDLNLNQFVFNPAGDIHLCAEEAHSQNGVVGVFYPEFKLNQAAWRRIYLQSPLELERCKGCAMLPVCAGGCQLASGHNAFLKSYCQSVHDCFEYGLQELVESREVQA